MEYKTLGYYSKCLFAYKPRERKREISADKPIKILRVLCQRPYFTGSGINLINLTKKSAQSGFQQYVIFGQPACESKPLERIVGLENTDFVKFYDKNCPKHSELSFPVAGMSDKMPYNSTAFSEFTNEMLEQYLSAFTKKINKAIEHFQPTIVHCHHLWLITALSRVLCNEIPVIATCHNTALRQMILAPHLKPFVVPAIQNLDGIAVINKDQQERVEKIYEFKESDSANVRFFYIGQGINTDIFYPRSSEDKHKRSKNIMYVGKLNFSKGVPQLLQAFKDLIREEEIDYDLYLAGSGKGGEKEKIIQLAEEFEKRIHFLGQISQEKLAEYLRDSQLFILPSFYEGFPKVLLESLACGCSAIITDLPGVRTCLENACGDSERVEFIPLPKMKSIEQPKKEVLPSFVENLKNAIKAHIQKQKTRQEQNYARKITKSFGWNALFNKYKDIYNEVLKGQSLM